VLRAKIVLAASRREPNAKIARDLGICVDTVRTWRHRFRREGIPGLFDRPRSGRPLVYGIEGQLLIVRPSPSRPPRSTRTGRTKLWPITSMSRWESASPRSGGSSPHSTSNPTGSVVGSTGPPTRRSTPRPRPCARSTCTYPPTPCC
jgi:hypothetical protein